MMEEVLREGRQMVAVLDDEDDGDDKDDAAAAAVVVAAAASISSSIFSIRGALTAKQLIKSAIYLQR